MNALRLGEVKMRKTSSISNSRLQLWF